MTELDLYRFLQDNSVETRWDGDVLSAWLSHWHLEEFTKLVGPNLYECGIESRLMSDGSVWIDLVPICEDFGIDPKRIVPVTDSQR
jgi:hypothetical protein